MTYAINEAHLTGRSLEKLQDFFQDNEYLVVDNFLQKGMLQDFEKFLSEIESQKRQQDPSGMTPWPWVLRFALDDKPSYLSQKKGYPLTEYSKLVQEKFRSDAGDGMYYWFYYTRPCMGKPDRDLADHYYCTAVEGAGYRPKELCEMCRLQQDIQQKTFFEFINTVSGECLAPNDELSLTLTRYDQESFLSPHTDNSSGKNPYKLTFIYYVNPDHGQHEGGELKLDFDWEHPVLVKPVHNRLVLFKPGQHTHHEVLPLMGEGAYRYALSGWYIGRDKS